MNRRQFATVAIAVLLTFVSASAVLAFQNPSQDPPGGNTPGVIWNTTAAQTASFNITGTGKVTGGGAFGTYNPDPTYGVTTPNLYAQTVCLGAPADCRNAWPAAGGAGTITEVVAGKGLVGGGVLGSVTLDVASPAGGGITVSADGISLDSSVTDAQYVNVGGDTMTGNLILQGANLIGGGSAALGGYAIDPSYAVTTPSLYAGAPGSNNFAAYFDGNVETAKSLFVDDGITIYGTTGNVLNVPNGTAFINRIYTPPHGGPAVGADITTGVIAANSATINKLTSGNFTVTAMGVGGLAPTAGIGVNAIGSTYGIYAETTGVGSSYAGWFVGDIGATGHVVAHKSTHIGDVSEYAFVDGPHEAGDVVVSVGVDAKGLPRFVRSSRAADHAVAGVISADPSLTLGNDKGKVPLAISGIVKVKAMGPVVVGDLLVSSDAPGHAMRCPDAFGCPGVVVGKALQDLKIDRGFILMMVMLR